MIQQITRGLKVSIQTTYQGSFVKNKVLHYAFRYHVSIENQSNHIVQLISRQWKVFETASVQYFGKEKGILKKPTMKPGETYVYNSGCLLTSPIGSIQGSIKMIEFSTAKKFNIKIPCFKLNVPFILN